MSVGPQSQADYNLIEQTRKHINRLIEEIARLSDQDIAPADYYSEFLQRVQQALAATAGAVWAFTAQGHLQLQFQINVRQVGIDQSDTSRQTHGELLRLAVTKSQPLIMMPHSGVDGAELGTGAGNPTDFMILLVPVMIEKQVSGLVEVFQDANRNPQAHKGYLQFLTVVADLAARFMRNIRMRQMSGQQQVWTQLEAFTRQVHGSLNPIEVAYQVVNEGNRLIGSDRLSVAHRLSGKVVVDAISGADVVERRSNLVQLMRSLFEKVLEWDERLIYNGNRDDSLPPDVLKALDDYLSESNSKLLAVLPVRDDREKDNHRPCRSALLMECFEPNQTPDALVGRLDVVGKHSVSALYNSLEHRRIPMRFIWQPLAKLQEGLGGKTRAIMSAVGVALAVLAVAMVVVPYPLKMDSKGQLLPQERAWIFTPVPASVERFEVEPGTEVRKGDSVALMHDLELEMKLVELNKRIESAQSEIQAANAMYQHASTESERKRISIDKKSKEHVRDLYMGERDRWRARTNAEESVPGNFWLKAPLDGTILNFDFRENLAHKYMKPSEPILRIGNKRGPWEVALKVPQKHIGQILLAFDKKNAPKELDVDLLLLSAPTRVFKGKLSFDQISGEATPNRDDNNESEPVVPVIVRIEGSDIDARDRIPRDLLLTGSEVHAKVRCGNHAMGYSLFYGVWEFIYEKIVFFF